MISISKSSKQRFYSRQLDCGNFFLFHRSILVQTKTRMHSELHDATRTRRFDLHKRSRLRNFAVSHARKSRDLVQISEYSFATRRTIPRRATFAL